MNPYIKNLEKIEFVITYACTGRCKHCFEGDHDSCSEHIDAGVAADAVRKVAGAYSIKTLMTFGGEPLIYPDAVYEIHRAATEMEIPVRQVITNGYFSKDISHIKDVAFRLAECGVNVLLLSVDAFHQETIPLEPVMFFAEEARSRGIPIKLQPAWLVSPNDKNPYNLKTMDILEQFSKLGFTVGEGNIIYPEGNARKYLSEYFDQSVPENPYIEDARDVRCLSFLPNGDVLDGNVYKSDILEIIECYNPEIE